MLEAMRQNSRSAIIYILFGILIAAFIISFGPGSSGGPSFSAGERFAARVDGHEVSERDFVFASIALGIGNLPGHVAREQRVKEFLMDRLIERELLAAEGERMGLAASENEAALMVTEGRMLVAGMPRRIEGYAFRDGRFDYDRFRLVAQNHYRVTIKELMAIQQRELLADKVKEVLRAAVRVSPQEVQADFEERGRQVNLEYVRFSPRHYEDQVFLSDADVENWARTHEEQIKKVFDERKYLYQKQDRSAHLRRILLELPKDAPEDAVQRAQQKMESIKKTLQSGTRFAEVARTETEDHAARARGGDMGWRKKGFTGLPEEVEAKIFAAQAGDLIGPVRTDRGLELIKVEGFREGDITLGQARAEIAEELARAEKTRELARAEAAAAAAKVKAGKPLSELFPKLTSDAEEAKPKTGRQALQVEETGLFSRRGDIVQGLGNSLELTRAAFKTLQVGETIGPIEVAGTFVVATLKERKEPDMADWNKRKAEIIEEYQRTRWAEVLQAWSRQRCTEAHNAGKIRVNHALLEYEGTARDPIGLAERKYEPCSSNRLF